MIAVVAAVLGAIRRTVRRKDLTRLAVLIALGVPMQGVVGAIVVRTKLNPFANQQHFLLSMVLVALGTVLVHRAGQADGARRMRAVSRPSQLSVVALTAMTAVALITGTFVTGAGPHAGDETAKRFRIAITTVARIHSLSVLATIAVAIALTWSLRKRAADKEVLDTPLTSWMVVAIGQAAIGYTQYFTDVPAALVAIHVAAATGLWLVTVRLWLSLTTAGA